MQRYNLRLSDKEYEDMKKMSALTERSINDLIREAIREYVEKKERETKG
jgi:predicted DNA-binding protein